MAAEVDGAFQSLAVGDTPDERRVNVDQAVWYEFLNGDQSAMPVTWEVLKAG